MSFNLAGTGIAFNTDNSDHLKSYKMRCVNALRCVKSGGTVRFIRKPRFILPDSYGISLNFPKAGCCMSSGFGDLIDVLIDGQPKSYYASKQSLDDAADMSTQNIMMEMGPGEYVTTPEGINILTDEDVTATFTAIRERLLGTALALQAQLAISNSRNSRKFKILCFVLAGVGYDTKKDRPIFNMDTSQFIANSNAALEYYAQCYQSFIPSILAQPDLAILPGEAVDYQPQYTDILRDYFNYSPSKNTSSPKAASEAATALIAHSRWLQTVSQ